MKRKPKSPEILATYSKLMAENKRLKNRLEIDFAYDINGKKVRWEDGMADGIEVRDIKIRELRNDIEYLVRELKKRGRNEKQQTTD